MHARERLIQERFATHNCADCGWPYAPRGVLVLARRRSAWMVLVTCAQCGRRAIFVVSFPTDAARSGAVRGHPTSAGPEQATTTRASAAPADVRPNSAPISPADVSSMHEFLATFDGDFRRAFTVPPAAPPNP